MDSNSLRKDLMQLGFSYDECQIYLTLLSEGKSSHLKLHRSTGITRSKVYRIVEQLEHRGLVTHHTDDTGRFLVASDPDNLTIQLTAEEEELEHRRQIISSIIPDLTKIKNLKDNTTFSVREYEGDDGFRQMLWQELKAEKEILVLGGATVEELAPNPRWAERHRAATIEAGYITREILNERSWDLPFTSHDAFKDVYSQRYISKNVLNLGCQITIFNDTTNIYHWRNNQRIGIVVMSPDYTMMMRQFFEMIWLLGAPWSNTVLSAQQEAELPSQNTSAP
jgi:sugar-specific transcriptional regulator TrmB